MDPFSFRTFSKDGIEIRSSIIDSKDEYMNVAYEILHRLLFQFAKLSMKAYRPRKNAYNLPYMYSERRLDSVVTPALSDICDGLVLTEMPAVRKKSKKRIKSKHGRVDYWCIFKGYTFVIEMKGSHDRFDCETVREYSLIRRWGKMIEQLNEVAEECELMEEKTKGVIRLGLHFVSSWSPKVFSNKRVEEYREGCDCDLNVICDSLATCCNTAGGAPTYAAVWLIPDKMVYWKDATYPGVMLIAKAFEDIKHKPSDE